MIQEVSQAGQFRKQLTYLLKQETLGSLPLTIARNATVYNCGESDELVYFIESGKVKLVMLSPEDRECLLAIHTTGDIFGEMCLSGACKRLETATAMEETVVKRIDGPQLFTRLGRDHLFMMGFVQYLAVRIADQQQVITNLTTVDSEQRLGKTLLRLAQTLGIRSPDGTRIELRITHEELSEMVGTTRPRISVFMQRFKNLGLIDTTADHFLTVREEELAAHLVQTA